MPLQKLALGLLVSTSLALAVSLPAAIFPSDTGDWPQEWPEELEPFRRQATTLGVGTGIQENIYTIPFDDRAAFEEICPVILQVKTPGSPLRLYGMGEEKHSTRHLGNAKPCVRIHAPSEGYVGAIARDEYAQRDALVKAGRILHVSAPWPEHLVAEDGSLPEYVVAVKDEEGRLHWEPGQPGDEHQEFYHRARVDIELVVDGHVIDLNRIPLPPDTPIIDKRFKDGTTRR